MKKINKFGFEIKIRKKHPEIQEESNLCSYAESELARLESDDEDGMQKVMNEGIIDIIRAFSGQGYSGFSASYAINILTRLLKFKPIGVLTGEDDEWNECSGMRRGLHTYQNKRCFSVFKDVDAEGNIVSCHDIDGIICSDNVPDKPEKIYLKELSEDERIVITDPDEIEALRVEKRREMDEAYARDKAAGWGQ